MPPVRANDDKKCATCEFWGGGREIDRVSPQYIKADSGSFPCAVRQIKCIYSSSACPKYKKWTHLP